ncbi:GNAT family N-acetyltransferase [Mycolicibacterium thermoresistibile]
MVQVEVQPARRGMANRLGSTLGRAFQDDPLMVWMLPDPGARARGLPRIFAAMTRHHFLGLDASEVAGTAGHPVAAAALWDPPGHWKSAWWQDLLMMPAFLRAFGRRAAAARQADELMKKHHPEEPHWYLAVIGSDPAVRGRGFGQALMRSRLDRVDAEHAPAYLECTNPDNVAYYQRFGFDVTAEIVLPDGGPRMFLMWRPAR